MLSAQQEEWRIIKDFPDYDISNRGRVRRNTDSCRQYKAGMELKIGLSSRGYHQVQLYNSKKVKNNLVHKLVLEAFLGVRPKGFECNHKDGVKTNNKVMNLEWVTHSENEKHAFRTGLKCQEPGDGCQNSKLKSGEVWLIKKLLASELFSQSFIAAMFKVCRENISAIKLKKSWSHIVYAEE